MQVCFLTLIVCIHSVFTVICVLLSWQKMKSFVNKRKKWTSLLLYEPLASPICSSGAMSLAIFPNKTGCCVVVRSLTVCLLLFDLLFVTSSSLWKKHLHCTHVVINLNLYVCLQTTSQAQNSDLIGYQNDNKYIMCLAVLNIYYALWFELFCTCNIFFSFKALDKKCVCVSMTERKKEVLLLLW